MSWLLVALALAGPADMTSRIGASATGAVCLSEGAPASPRGVKCRWECLCFRVNGYRCRRFYTEPCQGRACWQCQAQLTERARKSCSIGSPVKRCWCKFMKL